MPQLKLMTLTRQSITGFAEKYVASGATYQQAVMDKDEKSVPGYPDGKKPLRHQRYTDGSQDYLVWSTPHRRHWT